jgi:hypothetical protein
MGRDPAPYRHTYHWVYRENSALPVADPLICERRCRGHYVRLRGNRSQFDLIAAAYGRQVRRSHARGIRTRLQSNRMDGIFQRGLRSSANSSARTTAWACW